MPGLTCASEAKLSFYIEKGKSEVSEWEAQGLLYNCPWDSPTFISIHQHSPTFTSIHQHSPAFISIHQHSPAFTSIHQHSACSYRSIADRFHSANYAPERAWCDNKTRKISSFLWALGDTFGINWKLTQKCISRRKVQKANESKPNEEGDSFDVFCCILTSYSSPQCKYHKEQCSCEFKVKFGFTSALIEYLSST